MNDEPNLYPNDGQVAGLYETPEDQTLASEAANEVAKVSKSIPIVEDVLEWFDDQIELCNSLRNIDLGVGNLSVEAQVLAYQKLAMLLMARRDEYAQWYESWRAARHEGGKDAA